MILKKIAKDSAIYGGADLISKGIAFFTFPLIASALNPAGFGVLELILTITQILGLLVGCGLSGGVSRFYWDKDTDIEQRPLIVSSGLATIFVFGLIAMILGLLAIPIISCIIQENQMPFTWVALTAALFYMVFNQWISYLLNITRLHFKPFHFMSVSLFSKVGSAFLGVWVVVVLNMGIDGLLSAQALATFVVLPIALFYIRKDLTLNIKNKWSKELVQYGYPFIFAGLAFWIFGSIDRWMLASMSSVEEVGIYAVSFRFASVILLVSAAFGKAWSPMAMKIKTDHSDEYRKIYGNILLILLFIMLMIGGSVALFSSEIIILIMPDAYVNSSMPLSILCFAVIFQATLQVTMIGISLEKKTYLFAWLSWITAVINLLLNWLLIPFYGAVGAAWATALSYIVLSGSYLYFTQRLHPMIILWKRLYVILLLGGVVGFVAVGGNTTTLSLNTVCIKLLVVLVCLTLGWISLPVKKLEFKK